MKRDLVTFWEYLGYSKSKGLLDVGPSMWERRLINTLVIMDVVDAQERKISLVRGEICLYMFLIFL